MHRLQDPGRNPRKTDGVVLDTSDTSGYRGRFAPSPTGSLHLGSLYTAVASFLEARSRDGQWLVRIDDADTLRNVDGAADDILKTLEIFGLHWDEALFYQTCQQEHYEAAIDNLRQRQRVYPCICTRKALAALHSNGVYPGFCRNKMFSGDKPHALRVKTDSEKIEFEDQLQGVVCHDIAADYGDFIIKRKDHIMAYQLAVVVDDELQQISHVMRGLDLLDSTPRQIYLQRLLGFKTPAYLHIPIITDENGDKLSKQTFAEAINKKNPEKTLFHVLKLLKQEPPAELENAAVIVLLEWAVENWRVGRLKNIKSISESSTQLPEQIA